DPKTTVNWEKKFGQKNKSSPIGPPVEPVVEPLLSKDLFDEFEYEDEALNEAKGYYTEEGLYNELFENPWRNQQDSPALEESLKDVPLNPHRKEKALGMLLVEKDIFARDVSDLGQTDLVTHEIDTSSASPIKQAPYYAAPSIRAFKKKEVAQLKAKELV
ncbi:5700_t:CDS:2, partial [Dentiscutata heterogama]